MAVSLATGRSPGNHYVQLHGLIMGWVLVFRMIESQLFLNFRS